MDDSALEQLGKRFSPWQRGYDVEVGRTWEYVRHDFDEPFDFIIDENIDLDIYTKRVTMKVSKSVVSIECRLGDQQIFCGSGTVIECNDAGGYFALTILTSASVVHHLSNVEDGFKILVRTSGGEVLNAELLGEDVHYNVATIKTISYKRLPAATISRLEDSILFHKESGEASLPEYHSQSCSFKISPGDKVIALGRFHQNDCEIMAAPGIFRIDTVNFDCKELCVSTCRITKCGIGGPVINCYGDVIGISFYDEERTPFLPTNVAISWWEYFKENKRSIRPWLGVEVVRLTLVDLDVARKIFRRSLHVINGVIVTKVMPHSPAEQVGIFPGDVITKSGDNVISSSLKLFEAILDKVGSALDLAVIKVNDPSSTSYIRVKVGEINEEQFNRWPLPKAEKIETAQVRSWDN